VARAPAEKSDIWSTLTVPEGGAPIISVALSTVRGAVNSTVNFFHWAVSPVKALVNTGALPS
jgi:hypothetical protein